MHDESLRESVDLRESCGKAKLILERIVPTISLLFPGYTCLVIDRGFIAFGATECYLRLNDRLGFDRFSSLGGLGGIGCLGGLRFVVFSTSDSHRLTWLNIASWYDVKLFVVIVGIAGGCDYDLLVITRITAALGVGLFNTFVGFSTLRFIAVGFGVGLDVVNCNMCVSTLSLLTNIVEPYDEHLRT
jgi:hypothetical protein